jgi:hypothetical protein
VVRIADTVSSVYAQVDFEMPPATLARLAELQQRQNERERGYDYDAAHIDGFDFFDAFVAEVEDEHNAVLATLRLTALAPTDSRTDALEGVGD